MGLICKEELNYPQSVLFHHNIDKLGRYLKQ